MDKEVWKTWHKLVAVLEDLKSWKSGLSLAAELAKPLAKREPRVTPRGAKVPAAEIAFPLPEAVFCFCCEPERAMFVIKEYNPTRMRAKMRRPKNSFGFW